MIVIPTFDSTTSSAPVGFFSCVNAVCQYFDTLFTNNVTFGIKVGYGSVNGSALSTGNLGESRYYYYYDSYSQMAAALKAQGAPGSAYLPTTSPGGAQIGVNQAEALALGLYAGNTSGTIGSVGFSSTAKFNYSPLQSAAVSGKYDFDGVVMHEITEVMGRDSLINASNNIIAPMDLFRYSAPGYLQSGTGAPSYFSVDGGATNLNNWNNYQTGNSGDLGDWAPSAGNDSFRDNSNSGVLNILSAADKINMAALGWTVSTAGNAAGIAASIPTMGAVAAISAIGGQTATYVNVADGAANVSAQLSGLVLLANNGNLGTVTLTDSGTPTMSLSYAAASADQLVLGAITNSSFALALTGVAAGQLSTALALPHAASVAIADSAANIGANIDAIQTQYAAGKVTAIADTDSGPSTLTVSATQIAADAALIQHISGNFTVAVTGTTASIGAFLAQQDMSGRGMNGIGADYAGTAPSGGNSVVGFQNATFTSGVDTVLLDNAHSHYAVQVSAAGVVTIKDINSADANFGQTVTLSGDSYIIFNGASLAASTVTASGAPTYPGDMLFIESPQNAQMAQFYAAILQRIPDLGGLEYWLNQQQSGLAMTTIAQSFINTTVFSSLIGANPASLTPTQYVTDLYQSILGRAPDPGGLSYWVSQMNGGQTQAQVLLSFSNATASVSAVNAYAGGSGWLITPSVIGGYADSGAQMSASTVLANAAASHFYNLSLVDPTTVDFSTVSGAQLVSGGLNLYASAASSTIYMAPAFAYVSALNNGNLIHDGGGVDTITLTGGGNYITLGSSSSATLNIGSATGTYVFGYNSSKVTLPLGSVVQIGNIGGGSAAEVAAAYHSSADATLIGTDSGGDAQIWTSHGGTLTQVVTIIGVPAANVVA